MSRSLGIDTDWCRQQFPALSRQVGGRTAAYFDGPAGTQVPRSVIEAIGRYLTECNANHGGCFVTSQQSDVWLREVHQAVADLLGASEPETVVFGANMTSLTMSLSRSLARQWRAGDEIMVTRLEHDANFTPWVSAATEAGATVRYVDIHPDTCTLDLDDLQRQLSDRTRLVAVGCASNATGTQNPVARICRWARDVGAISFLDAVHFAPHDFIDVAQFECDFLACSAYKFFGPHQGILWGRRDLLESVTPYKLRPASDGLPDRWMTGTQNHECLAGTLAAVDYLAELGKHAAADPDLPRRSALQLAFAAIRSYERELVWQLIEGLTQVPGLRIWGITDRRREGERLPTVAFTHPRMKPREIAVKLGRQGFFVWHGNYYALPLTERLGLEPDGMVRVGLVHYNTIDEVADLVHAITRLLD